MMERKIQIREFETLAILDYQGIQEPNQHGKVIITALINSDREAEYRNKAENITWIEIVASAESGEEKILFSGVLISMLMKRKPHECIMTLELATGTILLEREVHTRSFQSNKLTFRDVINICNEGYEDADVIMTVGKEERIPHFILQYNTDDWQFLQRICALNGGVLVPSCTVNGVKYFFGMPKTAETAIFNMNCYTAINGETLSYAIESREIYFIGTKAEFKGESFFIWKVESKLKHGELYHTYYISKDIRKLIKAPGHYDKEITGASLFGEVLAVKNEKVKISIAADENKENAGDRWFPFSTVYSSSDGAGWYCMPEAGDKIRLCLPTFNEGEAYVCSAVHENEGDGVRTNCDHKIWRNKYGKEIRLTPDRIILTNNKGNSVELSDEQGIHIKSSGSVNLKAGGRIQISSENAGIEVAASSRIRLQQGESEMLLQDGVEITGTKVNIM